MIYSDLTLSRKLERTEARANADFVETRKRLFPDSDATWIEVAGAYAMFDGVDSPLTQTFGLGVFDDITHEHLAELEAFFKDRGCSTFHEVSPMADQSLMSLLAERGYRPIELTSVMYRELGEEAVFPGQTQTEITTRRIDGSEADIWAETAAAGWSTIHESLGEFMLNFGKIAARTSGGHPFVAEIDGRTVAAGGLQMYEDVGVLAGATTVPDARRRGAQNALLSARLRYAVEQGCTLAMVCALPGSQSQKNAQRNGFSIAYTRTKWHLPL